MRDGWAHSCAYFFPTRGNCTVLCLSILTLLYYTVLSLFSHHNTSKAVSLFFGRRVGGESVTMRASIFRGSPTGRPRKRLHSLAPRGAYLSFYTTKIPTHIPTCASSRPSFAIPLSVGNPDCHARELSGSQQTRRRAHRSEEPFPPKL